MLDGYSDKRRLLFVHVPKCAGTDLRENLRMTYPLIDRSLTDRVWTDPATLFATLESLLPRLRVATSVVVHGHVSLGWYRHSGLQRPGDGLYAVVRDPVEIALSQVNYVLTALLADPEAARPDSRDWLARMGMARLPPDRGHAALLGIAGRILLDTDIVPRDTLCHYLGNGDAGSALDQIAATGVEIVDTDHYPAWLERRFGIVTRTRLNDSRVFLIRTQLTAAQRARLADLTRQDRLLYPALPRFA
jgi:hypothetical protein